MVETLESTTEKKMIDRLDFGRTETQKMIADTVRDFLCSSYHTEYYGLG
jgi:hypothetical protein